MSKSRVTSNLKEKPVKWPRPKPERSDTAYNKATKSPTVKQTVSGGNFD